MPVLALCIYIYIYIYRERDRETERERGREREREGERERERERERKRERGIDTHELADGVKAGVKEQVNPQVTVVEEVVPTSTHNSQNQ
jgi:hypothetical protein